MPTLYARREPASDEPQRRDVVLYRDREATQRCAVYPWHYRTKPDRRHRHVRHNCRHYSLEWLAALD